MYVCKTDIPELYSICLPLLTCKDMIYFIVICNFITRIFIHSKLCNHQKVFDNNVGPFGVARMVNESKPLIIVN